MQVHGLTTQARQCLETFEDEWGIATEDGVIDCREIVQLAPYLRRALNRIERADDGVRLATSVLKVGITRKTTAALTEYERLHEPVAISTYKSALSAGTGQDAS